MKRRRALLLSITIVLAPCAACGWWLHREQRQYTLNRQLIAALLRNDTKTALELVNAGAEPNTRLATTPAPTLPQLFKQFLHRTPPPVNNSLTPFIMACGVAAPLGPNEGNRWIILKENLPLIQALLTHGANVNTKSTTGNFTALHTAVQQGRASTVELLLKHGANVNVQDYRGNTPLIFAAQKGTQNVVHSLLVHGANPNIQNDDGEMALYSVVEAGYTSEVTDLLAHGADPNLPNKQGQTLLMLAKELKRPDLVRLLKQHGAK